jgi:hypothetical protein
MKSKVIISRLKIAYDIVFYSEDVDLGLLNNSIDSLGRLNSVFTSKYGINVNSELVDTFTVVFNNPSYLKWREFDYDQQKEVVKQMLDYGGYKYYLKKRRGKGLGKHNVNLYWNKFFRNTIDNAIDSFSNAAFNTDKYLDQYPAVQSFVFNKGDKYVMVLLDNGIGEKFKKPELNLSEEYQGEPPYYKGGAGLALRRVLKARLFCYGKDFGAVQAKQVKWKNSP